MAGPVTGEGPDGARDDDGPDPVSDRDGPDRATVAIYDDAASWYAGRRGVQRAERARAFDHALGDGSPRLDLGCGPGHYLSLLGRPAVAADASLAMLAEVPTHAADVARVAADLGALPWRDGTFAGVWASKAHQHLVAEHLPAALAEVHRVLEAGGRLDLTMFAPEDTATNELAGGSDRVSSPDPPNSAVPPVGSSRTGVDDDLAGRLFVDWPPEALRRVLVGAGFSVDRLEVAGGGAHPSVLVTATRLRSLPDHVGPGMRLLCCGLNPSLHAADAGVGYVTASNRFWPAMADAGLATADRDPRHLLAVDGIGLTDLVKRATTGAGELTTAEYDEGRQRLDWLCKWLEPAAVCLVGLAGWRATGHPKAAPGWQDDRIGGRPTYVMPSTSGLNARLSRRELADHLGVAVDAPDGHPD